VYENYELPIKNPHYYRKGRGRRTVAARQQLLFFKEILIKIKQKSDGRSDEHLNRTKQERKKDNHAAAALSACARTVAKSLLAPKEDLTLSILRCARSLYRRSPPAALPAPAPAKPAPVAPRPTAPS
jgi:hypothetical protein